ncbi:MAG: GDSL-type esterase/lipase family protein [Candidatus Binatia bacterium]
MVPGWEGYGPLGEHIRINAAGLRGAPVKAKAPGTIRIVVLGDSFTFGLGVEEADTFPASLERSLTAALGHGTVEVLNAGVPGYNLFQERGALASRVPALTPDVIVLGFVENDLYNLDGSDAVATADGSLIPRVGAFQAAVTLNPFSAVSGPWLWLEINSALFRTMHLLMIRKGLAVHGDADLSAVAHRGETENSVQAQLLRGDTNETIVPHWELATRELQSAALAAERIGAPLVLVFLPRPEQLFSGELRGGFRRIESEAERLGIHVIDPTPLLADEPDRIGLYLFPADHHPSARCYARIAKVVSQNLISHGFWRANTALLSGELYEMRGEAR